MPGRALILALLLGCAGPGRLARLDSDSRILLADARAIRRRAEVAIADFDAAAQTFERATSGWDRASARYAEASASFERAALAFRVAATFAVLAGVMHQQSAFCADHMPTSAFRRRLRAEGLPLEGVDVDHAWPRALGGADHAMNYQALDASLNRSLGASVARKFALMPLATLRGLAVSAMDALLC